MPNELTPSESEKARYKWTNEDYPREWFETTTERMQYHYGAGRYLASAPRLVGTKELPWVAEYKPHDKWLFVGEFHTGREARQAAISAFENFGGRS